MTRMDMFRQFFPENDPLDGKEQIDTPEVIDGEYLSGAFDGFLEETGLSPEEIGVSPGAVEYCFAAGKRKVPPASSSLPVTETGETRSSVPGPVFRSAAQRLAPPPVKT